MPRKIRSHVVDDAAEELDPSGLMSSPREIQRQEFGRRVYRRMIAKGWNQADIHRATGLTRDSVSTYVRGLTLPTPESLERLATALGCEPDDLLPNYTISATRNDAPEMEMKVSPAAPERAYLRINRLVSLDTALKVLELIKADPAKRPQNGAADGS